MQKTVAETVADKVREQSSIPSTSSELEAGTQEVAEATSTAPKVDNLAKARAAKAAKAAARKTVQVAQIAQPEQSRMAQNLPNYLRRSVGVQNALDAELAADRHAFGEIREVAKTVPTAEEYIKVEMPLTDLFDHTHPGVQLNRHKFEPGKTYLLRGDVALEVKRRLAMFHDEQVRLLRPNADRKALNDVNRGSQWTSRGSSSVVPLGKLEDLSIASDEKIYTVDF